MPNTTSLNGSNFIIVGCGAAGSAAAKCFAAAGLANQTLLFEQHSEPGGSAGYFTRGHPKRTFDAGATQLIECRPGQLQRTLFELSPAQNQPVPDDIFELIPSVTQHWSETGKKIAIHADGRIEWLGPNQASKDERDELAKLQKFLSYANSEADWMWALLSAIPRFPPQSLSDVLRALQIFVLVPWQKKLLFPLLFLMNCRQMMNLRGIRSDGLAADVIRGLLVDTTQNTPEKSPWLAASLGVSIIQRGIFRCRKGMRSYFRPLLSSYSENGGSYHPHQKLTRVETTPHGFKLSFQDQRQPESLTVVETDRSVLLNVTVWDMVHELIPVQDPLRNTLVFRRWSKVAQLEQGWGAFAIYALIADQPDWPDAPHYHQMFARQDEPEELQSSLYVSIPARDDPANPEGYRVLTATIHVRAGVVSNPQRDIWRDKLIQRIEGNLKSTLTCVESATPQTFARYTARRNGQVGGFPLRLGNFLFFANPSAIRHPTRNDCQLILMGDTVFPGQGVIACTVSGIAAFERATKLTFQKILGRSLPVGNRQ